jgi:hypothetical protein
MDVGDQLPLRIGQKRPSSRQIDFDECVICQKKTFESLSCQTDTDYPNFLQ